MRCMSTTLVLPLALLGTSLLQAQELDRAGRGAEDRENRSAAEEFSGGRNVRIDGDERDDVRRAGRTRREDRRRGPEARDETRSDRRAAEGRRPGPRWAGGPEGFRRGPSARMLLARFDRDGDRELDLQELSRLVERMPRIQPFGPTGRPRGGAAFAGRGGPRPDGPRDRREFAGRGDRSRDGFGEREFDRPRGPRPEGRPERRPGRIGQRGGDDRGERPGPAFRPDRDD